MAEFDKILGALIMRQNPNKRAEIMKRSLIYRWLAIITVALLVTGCAGSATLPPQASDKDAHEAVGAGMLALPALKAADLQGRPLQVVATTSIIGDVAAQVGGEAIRLTVLIGPGQDPHSYQPAARDLTTVAAADVIFVNGWNLEEGLIASLASIGEDALLVPVSANIEPMAFGEIKGGEIDAHSSVDPHVWFSIHNVEQWIENIAQVLSDLDPVNAEIYRSNAAGYRAELADLADYASNRMAAIPAEKRFLVTNHGAFGYFARDYDLEVLGAVIPAMSTLAEPSASDLSNLIETMQAHNLCTIFTETTVSDKLAQTAAAELSGCASVQVLPLYTGSVGPAGSDADSYTGMFRANVDAIVRGLK